MLRLKLFFTSLISTLFFTLSAFADDSCVFQPADQLFVEATLPDSEKRVAIVAGVSNYYDENLSLRTPLNDAGAISSVLVSLGFDVYTSWDATAEQFRQCLKKFEADANQSTISIAHFAGHGLQVQDTNYTIFRDAQIRNNKAEGFVSMDEIIDAAYGAEYPFIFLDACRDTPNFTKETFILDGQEVTSTGSGLSSIGGISATQAGLFITYATTPGKVASDGDAFSANSPFTASLLTHIASAGTPISQLMTRVVKQTKKETDGAQTPWVRNSLADDVYLGGKNTFGEVSEMVGRGFNTVSPYYGSRDYTLPYPEYGFRINAIMEMMSSLPRTAEKGSDDKWNSAFRALNVAWGTIDIVLGYDADSYHGNYSPDGKMLALYGLTENYYPAGSLIVYDIENRKELFRTKLSDSERNRIYSVTFSQDSKKVFVSHKGGFDHVDITTKSSKSVVFDFYGQPAAGVFNPDHLSRDIERGIEPYRIDSIENSEFVIAATSAGLIRVNSESGFVTHIISPSGGCDFSYKLVMGGDDHSIYLSSKVYRWFKNYECVVLKLDKNTFELQEVRSLVPEGVEDYALHPSPAGILMSNALSSDVSNTGFVTVFDKNFESATEYTPIKKFNGGGDAGIKFVPNLSQIILRRFFNKLDWGSYESYRVPLTGNYQDVFHLRLQVSSTSYETPLYGGTLDECWFPLGGGPSCAPVREFLPKKAIFDLAFASIPADKRQKVFEKRPYLSPHAAIENEHDKPRYSIGSKWPEAIVFPRTVDEIFSVEKKQIPKIDLAHFYGDFGAYGGFDVPSVNMKNIKEIALPVTPEPQSYSQVRSAQSEYTGDKMAWLKIPAEMGDKIELLLDGSFGSFVVVNNEGQPVLSKAGINRTYNEYDRDIYRKGYYGKKPEYTDAYYVGFLPYDPEYIEEREDPLDPADIRPASIKLGEVR